MDLDTIVLTALVVGIVWFVLRRRRAKTDAMAQDVIERLAVGLMVQYPSANDTEIAQLIRDDLLNNRKREPLLFKWASVETVGRMRRTIVRQVIDAELGAKAEEK
jgi:hypothetical protein